jgi:prepilin-type N-terminal cleavage/methylation domain-containing protein
MLNKVRKALKSKEGFTLIELITVIVVLAIILGIGIPRYAMIQAQSEWDADVSTLRNLEKAAELWYARNPFVIGTTDKTYGSETVSCVVIPFKTISDAGQFADDTTLKRKSSDGVTSVRNSGSTPETLASKNPEIVVDASTGKVYFDDEKGDKSSGTDIGDGINDWMHALIGYRPK